MPMSEINIQNLYSQYRIFPEDLNKSSITVYFYSSNDDLIAKEPFFKIGGFSTLFSNLINAITAYKAAKILIIVTHRSKAYIHKVIFYNKLKELLQIIDVDLDDCIVLNKNQYYSFSSNNTYKMI